MSTAEKVTHVPVTHKKPVRSWFARRRPGALDPFEETDRFFNQLVGNSFMGNLFRPRWGWPAGDPMGTTMPRVDLINRDNEIVLRAEIPGVEKDGLDVSLSDNTVTLRASVKHDEEKEAGDYYYCETSRGEFARTVSLPAEVDGSKAKATYKDGIVELVLPKTPASKSQKIKVDVQ